MSRFERISEEQFRKDTENCNPKYGIFDVCKYKNLQLPKRATAGSAGYDFFSPLKFKLPYGCSIKIPTGIKCKLDDDRVLFLFPRSSYGIKYKIVLDNTCGIIDADYYNNVDNEGHIWFFLTNNGKKTLSVDIGDRFAQGIILPFEKVENDDSNSVRTGGLGSTLK